jgi:hypothetical protein
MQLLKLQNYGIKNQGYKTKKARNDGSGLFINLLKLSWS